MKPRKSLYGPVVGYHKRILEIVPNSKAAAIVMTQMIHYLCEYRADADGWFALDRKKCAERWDMSPNMLDRSREYWRGRGVLEEKVEGKLVRTVYCRVNQDELDKLCLEKSTMNLPSKDHDYGHNDSDSSESGIDAPDESRTNPSIKDETERMNETPVSDPAINQAPSAEESPDPAREWIHWLPMSWRGDDDFCSAFEQLVVQRGLDRSGAKLIVAKLKTWPDDRRAAILEWAVTKNARIVKYDPEKHAAKDFEQPVGASISVNPKDLPWV